MKIEDQVISLNLAKRMKELGIEQRSMWYWIADRDQNWDLSFCGEIKECPHILLSADPDEHKGDCEHDGECTRWLTDFWNCEYLHLYSAFTVAEVAEILPEVIVTEDDNFFIIDGKRHNTLCITKNRFRDKGDVWSVLYYEEGTCDYPPNTVKEVTSCKLSDALAKMVIWLKENSSSNQNLYIQL